MINNDRNDALEQAAPSSDAAALQHLAVPNGWKLVPVEPTPEIIAGAAIASWPTATLADIDLARQAAPLVLMQMDMAPGTTVDALAGMLATMAPAYRAMLEAAPKYSQLPAVAPQVVAKERATLVQNIELVINRLETISQNDTDIPRTLAGEALVCARAALAAAPMQAREPVTDASADIFDLIREWAHLPEDQRGDAARNIIGCLNRSYSTGVSDGKELGRLSAPLQPVAVPVGWRDAALESAVQAVVERAGESEKITVISAFDAIRSLKKNRHALPESSAHPAAPATQGGAKLPGIAPDQGHLVSLALSGALPVTQAEEILAAAIAAKAAS